MRMKSGPDLSSSSFTPLDTGFLPAAPWGKQQQIHSENSWIKHCSACGCVSMVMFSNVKWREEELVTHCRKKKYRCYARQVATLKSDTHIHAVKWNLNPVWTINFVFATKLVHFWHNHSERERERLKRAKKSPVRNSAPDVLGESRDSSNEVLSRVSSLNTTWTSTCWLPPAAFPLLEGFLLPLLSLSLEEGGGMGSSGGEGGWVSRKTILCLQLLSLN